MQRWGGPIEQIWPGDVVWIPPGEKHWHGATTTTAMRHIAIVEQLDGKSAPGKIGTDADRLQVSGAPEKEGGEGQLSFSLFGALVVG